MTCLDCKKSLDLQISSLVVNLRRQMLLWSTICFNETVLDKRWLDNSVEQIESDLERGFVKHWLNSV